MTTEYSRRDAHAQCRPTRLAIFLLIGIAGCSPSEYDVRPVRGVVTIDGRPMSAGRVMFAPVAAGGNINPGKPAFGHIQSDGSYTLTTYSDNDGAVVGQHSVTVYDTSDAPRFTNLLLPQRHAVEAESENVIDLSLTAEDVRKYGIKK